MSSRSVFVVGASAALGMVLGASTLAVAQFNPWSSIASQSHMRAMTDNWSEPTTVSQLASNEGIYVDMKEFKINKGVAKGDPTDSNKEIRRKRGVRWGDHFPLRCQTLHRGRQATGRDH